MIRTVENSEFPSEIIAKAEAQRVADFIRNTGATTKYQIQYEIDRAKFSVSPDAIDAISKDEFPDANIRNEVVAALNGDRSALMQRQLLAEDRINKRDPSFNPPYSLEDRFDLAQDRINNWERR